MKSNRIALVILIFLGVLFQAIFFRHEMGLNTLIFTAALTCLLFFFNKQPQHFSGKLLLMGLWMGTFGVLFGHTDYSLGVYWICVVCLLAVFAYPSMKQLQFAPWIAIDALKRIPGKLSNIFTETFPGNGSKRIVQWLKFVVIPFVVFMILLVLYTASNTYFERSLSRVFDWIERLFNCISMGRFIFGFMGFGIGLFFLIDEITYALTEKDKHPIMQFIRRRVEHTRLKGLSLSLLRKRQVAVVFFILINLMLAWLNILDMKYFWFDFTWNGGYLKEMVHEGTNLLIIAILISMAISLYYLNSNLVFLKGNRFFQMLITIWLIQNMVMVVSVAIRNTYYIQYFALAHKRIFVYFFLAACLVGLISILIKSVKFKTITFLFSINTVSVYVLLIMAACFNWDAIIARYNFAHYNRSYVHYNYLMDLNNAALPFLITDKSKLAEIDTLQSKLFHFQVQPTSEEVNFIEVVQKRKDNFIADWEQRNWLDWNIPESSAYEFVKEEQGK